MWYYGLILSICSDENPSPPYINLFFTLIFFYIFSFFFTNYNIKSFKLSSYSNLIKQTKIKVINSITNLTKIENKIANSSSELNYMLLDHIFIII